MTGGEVRVRPGHWWRRVGWLILIWGASVGGILLLALLLKWVMRAAGLSG